MKEFIKPLSFGVASVLGDGNQMTSWVHIDDICKGFLYAIEHEQMEGVFNLCAPAPVDNRTLITSIAKHRNGKLYLPVRIPAGILRKLMGEMSVEVLKSATVSSEKIQHAGFHFSYPEIDQAVGNLMK
jgi:NAD dependent epimerase/dehydratase family enzyme